MPAQFFAAVLVMTKLVTLKSAVMSADYRGDIAQLAQLRTEAAELSNDRKLGYLADYWSGYATWRIPMNAAMTMKPEEIQTELSIAAKDFESSIAKKSDFADAYVGDAGVHGWLAAFKSSDPPAMKAEIDIFKRQIERALELEPNNPRALWIEAVPYLVLPPERGGNLDRAIELYRKMLEVARPLDPSSPLPDWGTVEARMSIAYADIQKTSPDVDAADVEAREAIRLQPEWHYVKDILIPQIETKRRAHAFDYLLGDWKFTGNNRQYGAMRGFWSATRLDDSTIFDEFRIVGDHDETYYVTRTVRAFNAKSGEWELVSTENGGGLQNSGTATRDGGEVHIEQTFGAATAQPSRWRIRYYDIHPDHFSWVADRTNDGGKTWVRDFQKLDVKRIGPERPFALTVAKEVQH